MLILVYLQVIHDLLWVIQSPDNSIQNAGAYNPGHASASPTAALSGSQGLPDT